MSKSEMLSLGAFRLSYMFCSRARLLLLVRRMVSSFASASQNILEKELPSDEGGGDASSRPLVWATCLL